MIDAWGILHSQVLRKWDIFSRPWKLDAGTQGALGTTQITQIAHDSNSAFKSQGKLMNSVQQRMQSSVKWFFIPYCNQHFAIICQAVFSMPCPVI